MAVRGRFHRWPTNADDRRDVPLAGREGVREAYEAARARDRGARLAGAADDGYFERFPLVDARPVVR